MTEPLFRFLLTRPPVAQDARKPSIALAQSSSFQEKLMTALQSQNLRIDVAKVVKEFTASQNFTADPTKSEFQKKVRQFGTLVDEGSVGGDLQYATVLELVKRAFGVAASELVKLDEFTNLLRNLRDSVVAIKYDQGQHSRPLEDLVSEIRDLELISKAVELGKTSQPSSSDNASIAEKPLISTRTTATLQPLDWQDQTIYKIGDQVSYNSHVYVCIQEHTSLTGWEPPNTPALWVRVSRPNPDGDPIPPTGESSNLFSYRKRSLLLPTEGLLKSVLSELEDNNEGPPNNDDAEKEANALLKSHTQLSSAVKELTAMNPKYFQATKQVALDGVVLDDQYSGISFLTRQLDFQARLKDLNLDQFKAAAQRSGTAVGDAPDVPKAAAGVTALAADPLLLQDTAGSVSALGLTRELFTAANGLPGIDKFSPLPPRHITLKLQKDAPLSESTTLLLNENGIERDVVALTDLVGKFRQNMAEVEQKLKTLSPSFEDVQISRIGNTLVSIRKPRPSQFSHLITGIDFGRRVPWLPILPPPDPRVPHTIGKVNKIGVGDLLVVKQHLIAYEGADIAHIENVLRGESKNREHTRTDKTEATTSTEVETSTEDSHEHSSTSRFEMGQETEKRIKEDFEIKGSAQITAKYGPAVEFSAKVEGGYSRSKEESNKTATKFSQDVTEKAAKKITERVLQKSSTTVVSEVVEKNSHGIDNTSGGGNISGVYQWVNKVYDAQVYNYGLRTLFDFMVPEPAAWLINTMTKAADSRLMLEKPTRFYLQPDQISESNYGYWVSLYEATDVKPPPPDYITVTDHIDKGDGKSGQNYQHSGQIVVESGFQAIYAKCASTFTHWDKKVTVDVLIGSTTHRFTNDSDWAYGIPLDNERGSIPWAMTTWFAASVVITVEIKCAVTEDATNAWKADTHGKLVNAYKARLQEYEEKLATLKLQEGITIEGRNPGANLISVKQELKKNCISIITAQHFDHFNSITTGSYGHAQINLYEAEAEGEYVRFFEQAFEWEQIMYVMYPYFWGRKSYWADRLAFEDPDPQFDEFLKSGFARVQVPVRPGFEAAIDQYVPTAKWSKSSMTQEFLTLDSFLHFGELWDGGPLPPISSPLFLRIADEIAERAQKPGQEIPQGEPWKVRIPTTLVKLRPDDNLPKWKKNPDEEWVPDE